MATVFIHNPETSLDNQGPSYACLDLTEVHGTTCHAFFTETLWNSFVEKVRIAALAFKDTPAS